MSGTIFGALILSLLYIIAVLIRLSIDKEGLVNEYPHNVKKVYLEMHPEITKEKLEGVKKHKIAGIIVVTLALGILAYVAGARNDGIGGYILTLLKIYFMWAVLVGFHTGVVNYLIIEKMEMARLPYTESMDEEYEGNHVKLKVDLKRWAILGAPITIVASLIVFILQ